MFYLVLVTLSLNLSSWWWLWVVLEFLNWTFILFIKNMNFILFYLAWQSASSILALYSLLMFKNSLLMLLLMSFKAALPPFQMMFWALQTSWSSKSFIIFLTAHKYPVVLFIMNVLNFSTILWFLMFPLMGAMFFFLNSSIKSLIWALILSDTSWMMVSWLFSLKMMMFYLMFNLLFMLMMLQTLKFSFIFKSVNKSFQIILLLLLLTGLPPFASFVLKWSIVSSLSMFIGMFLMASSLMNMFIMWVYFYLMSVTGCKMVFMSPHFSYIFILLNLLWLVMI